MTAVTGAPSKFPRAARIFPGSQSLGRNRSHEQQPSSAGAHEIDLDGVTQRYHVSGSGPVLLVHPGGPGFSWEYIRLPAVEAHLTTVYVEPIGTGQSGRLATHPNGYTREEYARALNRLIVHLNVPKVHLLGHSHGGFVTQFYAQHHRDQLAGIILYESAPAAGPEHFAEAAANLDAFARANAGNPKLQDVLDAWRSVPSIASDEAFTTAARRLLPAYFADYWARERHDFICGPRWAREIHDLIPDSRLVVLEDSGHFGHVDAPGEFARTVIDFVGGPRRRS